MRNCIFDVTAIGELLIDFAYQSADSDGYPTLAAHPGGAPANYLAAIQKFGGRTAMISKVGNDAFGRMLISTLANLGISTQGVSMTDDAFTTLAFVTFNSEYNREFSFSRKPGADTCLSKEDLPLSLIDGSRVFHFGTLSLSTEPVKNATETAVRYAQNRGCLISFDPNLRKPLWKSMDKAREAITWGLKQADIVKISDDECNFLFGDLPYSQVIKILLERYKIKLCYITLGKSGCLIGNESGVYDDPGFMNLKTIDTTGAGDIFGGAAMWALLNTQKLPEALTQKDLKDIARFAGAAAGLSTTKPGGICSVPDLKSVLSLIQK